MSAPATVPTAEAPVLAPFGRLAAWVLGPNTIPTRPVRLRSAIGYLILFVAGTALALLRMPPSAFRAVWAEDASVFATGAYAHPWWQVVFEPYAGYALAYPRLLAALAVSLVDVSHLPLAFAILACATCAAAGVIAVWTLKRHIPALPLRMAIWALIVAMPIAGVEVNGNIANSHWYLLLGAILVLLTRQTTWIGIATAALVVAAAVLSDPLTILAAPLALLRLSDGGRRRWMVPSFFIVGAGVQVTVILGTHIAPTASRPGLLGAARAFFYRTMLQPLLGSSGAEYAHSLMGSWAILLGSFCVIGLLGLGLRTPSAGFALAAAAAGSIVFVVSGIVRWTPSLDPAVHSYLGASRYSVVPIALMSIAILSILSHSLSSFPRAASRVLLGVAVLIGVANLASIGLGWYSNPRAQAVSWHSEVNNALAQCVGDRTGTVKIAGDPPGFDLSISCADLERADKR